MEKIKVVEKELLLSSGRAFTVHTIPGRFYA
jgi:hypothetical protein